MCVAGRTLKAFETWLKKGARGTDYVFPSEMLVQMNVIVDFKNQHRYNEDEFLDRIQGEMRSSLMERVGVQINSNSNLLKFIKNNKGLKAADMLLKQ